MMTKDKLRQLKGDERLGQMRESEYLGAEDIDDGVEPVLTIAGLWNGTVTLQRGKENKDVSKNMISLYERGEKAPSVEALVNLADFFGVSTDYLLGRKNF